MIYTGARPVLGPEEASAETKMHEAVPALWELPALRRRQISNYIRELECGVCTNGSTWEKEGLILYAGGMLCQQNSYRESWVFQAARKHGTEGQGKRGAASSEWAVMSEEGGLHHRGPELPVMLASQDPPPLRALSTTIWVLFITLWIDKLMNKWDPR